MSSNGIVGSTSLSNDINLAGKYYVNNYDDNNFNKELIRIKRNFRKIIFYRSHN